MLRVVSAEKGTNYDDKLGPVIEEVDDLSRPLGEVWTDEFPAYQAMENEHRTVLHDEEYVSEEGVHTNQAECLWSLLQPWLAKFRALSKQGLVQATRTYGFLRSLNLAVHQSTIPSIASPSTHSANLPKSERSNPHPHSVHCWIIEISFVDPYRRNSGPLDTRHLNDVTSDLDAVARFWRAVELSEH